MEAGGRAEMTCAIVAGSTLPAVATTICRQSPRASLCPSATTPPPWPIFRNGMFSVLNVGDASGSACWTGGRYSALRQGQVDYIDGTAITMSQLPEPQEEQLCSDSLREKLSMNLLPTVRVLTTVAVLVGTCAFPPHQKALFPWRRRF